MALHALSKLSDWDLKDPSKDIRGRNLVDLSGRSIGTINELVVDTKHSRVDAVVTEDRRQFPVERLELRETDVVLADRSSSARPTSWWRDPLAVRCRSTDAQTRSEDEAPRVRLRSGKELRNAGVVGIDGELGKIHDVYFDDQTWTVRYLVVDTSKWLIGRKVLISPAAVISSPPTDGSVHLNLTRDQIRNSPPIDSNPPVSRQSQARLSSYYGWGAPVPAGAVYGYPAAMVGSAYDVGVPPKAGFNDSDIVDVVEDEDHDEHLRSMKEVIGYGVIGSDGDAGKVSDLAVDSDLPQIRYLAVDTSNMPVDRSVTVPVHRVIQIRWSDRKVRLRASRDEIGHMSAPPYPLKS